MLLQVLGLAPSHLSRGQMTYDLRRLRLHGLIERTPGTHRYRVSAAGLRTALFFTRVHARILRPGLRESRRLATTPCVPTLTNCRGPLIAMSRTPNWQPENLTQSRHI